MSTKAPNDAIARLHEQEDTMSSSLSVDMSRDNLDWLAMNDTKVDHIVRVERLRRENSREWAEIVAACRDENGRGILAGLALTDGDVTYDDLEKYAPCTRRTVRNHAYDLRDAGVIDIVDGRPATISFASDAIEVLTKDVLSVLITRE